VTKKLSRLLNGLSEEEEEGCEALEELCGCRKRLKNENGESLEAESPGRVAFVESVEFEEKMLDKMLKRGSKSAVSSPPPLDDDDAQPAQERMTDATADAPLVKFNSIGAVDSRLA